MLPDRALIARLCLAAACMAAAPAAVALPAPPVAASRLDDILARGVLRVGTPGDYRPFSVHAGDDWIGLDIDLAADLAKALGVRLQVVPTTWGALSGDLASDRFDLALGGISVTLERQKTAFFSIPMLRDGKTPIARCADAGRYATLAAIDRPGVRLIVNPGGTNERFARTNAPHATLVVHPDNLTIFDRLAAGDADVMVTDAVEARLQARLHPALCALHPDAPFDFAEKAVLLPRDPVLKAYVDQWLHQAIESGAYARLGERWLAYPWGVDALRMLVDARLALAADVARDKWNRRAPIEDLPREAQVLAALTRQAGALGVPQAEAEAFFRAQIEASKIAQQALWREWTARGQGPFPDAPDLATVTRPKLDRLTEQLMRALADTRAVLADPARRDDVVRAMRPASTDGLDAQAVRAAIAPIVQR